MTNIIRLDEANWPAPRELDRAIVPIPTWEQVLQFPGESRRDYPPAFDPEILCTHEGDPITEYHHRMTLWARYHARKLCGRFL